VPRTRSAGEYGVADPGRHRAAHHMPTASPTAGKTAGLAVADAAAAATAGDADRAETAYKEALPPAVESGDGDINNAVCWLGSVGGADLVMPACERAVEHAPERPGLLSRWPRAGPGVDWGRFRGR